MMAIHPGFAPLFEMMKPFIDMDWSNVSAAELRAFSDNPMSTGEPLAMAARLVVLHRCCEPRGRGTRPKSPRRTHAMA